MKKHSTVNLIPRENVVKILTIIKNDVRSFVKYHPYTDNSWLTVQVCSNGKLYKDKKRFAGNRMLSAWHYYISLKIIDEQVKRLTLHITEGGVSRMLTLFLSSDLSMRTGGYYSTGSEAQEALLRGF